MEEGRFELAAFYFGTKRTFSVCWLLLECTGGGSLHGGTFICVPRSAPESLHAVWRDFWIESQNQEEKRRSGAGLCARHGGTSGIAASLGLAYLSPDTAESCLAWGSSSCCWTLDLGNILWLCLSPQVETVDSPAAWLLLLSSCYLAPVPSFSFKIVLKLENPVLKDFTG